MYRGRYSVGAVESMLGFLCYLFHNISIMIYKMPAVHEISSFPSSDGPPVVSSEDRIHTATRAE